MEPLNTRILIHHHHLGFQDLEGRLWLTSTIGRWVDALSLYFSEVGLLLYESENQTKNQDTYISKANVRLISLGKRASLWSNFFNRKNIRDVCLDAASKYDLLLIRGVTPHQYLIWQNTPIKNKAFLLVGSLESKLSPNSLLDILIFLISKLRLNELRQMINKETVMLANSPALIKEIEKKIGVTASFVPTNTIRIGEYASLHFRQPLNPIRLLYCGRLDLNKGLRELFAAVAELNGQGTPCKLDIVGKLIEPVFSELQTLSNKLGINNCIVWHGLIPYGPELFAFYQQADALVLPSYTEGFPHVIWEAMANCCPVIASSVGGIPALITHETQALLIPPKNPGAIVTAVKRLFTDEDLRTNMVSQAYFYSKNFTVEACAQKLAMVVKNKGNLVQR